MRRAAASLARALSRQGKGAPRSASSASALEGSGGVLAPGALRLAAMSQTCQGPTLPTHARPFATASSQPPPTPPSPPQGGGVIEVQTIQDFQELLLLSQENPIVLDCWATWCGPCKQLDPVLQSVIASTGGAVRLAKLDIDNQALAPVLAQMQVTSVPTLFLVFGGRLLDVKVGAPSQQELRSWIAEAVVLAEQQLGRPLGGGGEAQAQAEGADPGQLLQAGFAALDALGGRAADAAPHFGAVLQHESADHADKARALAGLAMCALVEEPLSISTARELVANAKTTAPAAAVPEEVSRAEALVELAAEQEEGGGGDARGVEELAAAAAADPKDLQARYLLSLRQFAAGQHQAAIDTALALFRADRGWREQAAKKLLLRFFDALGTDSQLAKAGRRRLANFLFM